VIHAFDPAMAPDAEFVAGTPALLLPGNTGRMLDRRRTPVRVAELKLETGTWICEVLAFEDQGARWALPCEAVTRFQFARDGLRAGGGSARLDRQIVPLERVFMTYLETAAMNRQFREAEAVLFEDPDNPAF
jgi:hypothetical protein